MGVIDEILASQTAQGGPPPNQPTAQPPPAAPEAAPKNPNFLRSLLTDFIGTLAGQLKQGSFQQAVGKGIQAGTARGGTAGQAFGAAFGTLPEATMEREQMAVRNKQVQAQIEQQGRMAEMTERLRTEQERHNLATETQAATTATQRSQTAREKTNVSLRKYGVRINEAGDQEPIPTAELSPQEIAHLRADEKMSDLRDAMIQRTQAMAEYQKALLEPDSVPNRMKKQALEAQISSANQRIQIQWQSLGLQRERLDFAKQKFEMPTSATRTMMEAAPKVKGFIQRMKPLIQKEASGLGPLGGRWSEFWTGKVGAPDTEYTRLRVDAGLLQTLLMRMHVGARGGQMLLEHFKGLMDVGKQSPENMLAALEEIERYADDVAKLPSGAKPESKSSVPVYDLNGNRVN